MFVGFVARERQEGRVVNQLAPGEPQFAERLALGKKLSNRLTLPTCRHW